MAAQVVWQPAEEGLREICDLLQQKIAPTSDKSRIMQQLQHYNHFPDFNNYLAFIFARAEGESVEIRQAAGLLLKNNLTTSFSSLSSLYQMHIKREILPCLGASDINKSAHHADVTCILYPYMNQFLHGLFVLSRDSAAEVRQLFKRLSCCGLYSAEALIQSEKLNLVMAGFISVCAYLRSISEFMLQASRDNNEEVALEACEFWSNYCDSQVLLTNMAYADDDESLAEAEEDDSIPDREQDLKPRFHSSRFHDQMDDDSFNIWNLRKSSAASLDTISSYYGDDILPILMPLVQAGLCTSTDETWKEREAAVFALGAIAGGCIKGLCPHLAEIVEFLIPLLDDKFPLIRSITCWTLSRFSRSIVQCIGNQKGRDQFEKVLTGLLRRILDSNKQVQETACSAFATFEEDAADELVPHLEIFLQNLLSAFARYQRRNLRFVFDAIATLAYAVGAELKQLEQLSNSDTDILPLLECFTSIARVTKGHLRDLLLQCCMDDAPDIRQSIFGLVADLARETSQVSESVLVANNACLKCLLSLEPAEGYKLMKYRI